MTRHTLQTAIAAVLFASLAMVGCKQQTDDTAMTPPASEPAPMPSEPAPMEPAPAAAMSVTTVDLGNMIGADNRVGAPMTSFASTDTIHASVATDGASAGNLTAKWTFQDGQVIDTQDKSVPAGPQVTDFSITKPDGWPAGTYKLEVMSGGMTVQSREFTIK